MLFRLLPPEELQAVAHDLLGRVYDKSDDNVLALARLRWAPGFDVVNCLARRFEIPYPFLPHVEPEAPDVETIEPRDPLPPLHDYQHEVVQKARKLLSDGRAFLIQMPTGSGKTRTMVEALAETYGAGIGGAAGLVGPYGRTLWPSQ